MENQNLILYKTVDGKSQLTLYAKDGSVWLNQNQIAELFATSKPNISIHVSNILKEKELDAISVVKDYLTTAADDKTYNVTFYSLEMIMAIGFRVQSVRGTQFRQWAIQNLKQYMVKGFIIDSNRLKNPDGRPDYFDELLSQIRDIRASEKRFYQKLRDLFSISSDYDKTDKTTQMFFATTQNKILYAITGLTAAEIVISRANENLENMGLQSWQGNVVRKQDIYIAKNYLTADEIDSLNRFVTVFLETAELRAKNRLEITMDFWRQNIDKIIELNDKVVLNHKGKISNELMEKLVAEKYQLFDSKRKQYQAQLADNEDLKELKELELELKKK